MLNPAVIIGIVATVLLAPLGDIGIVAGGFLTGFVAGGIGRGTWVAMMAGTVAASLTLLFASPVGQALEGRWVDLAATLFPRIVREVSGTRLWMHYVLLTGAGGAVGGVLRPK